MILASAITCLALNVYFEARGEPIEGQQAVAAVTLNRAKDQDKGVCQVVTAPAQFSWTIGKLHRYRGEYVLPARYAPKNMKAWLNSWKIASEALKHGTQNIVHGATFYHTLDVHPAWSRDMEKVAVIGNHVFYVPAAKSQLNGEQAWNDPSASAPTRTTTTGTPSAASAPMASTAVSGQSSTSSIAAAMQSELPVVTPWFMLAICSMFAAVLLPLFLTRRSMPTGTKSIEA